ncbi:MAG TPA: response regulator [Thermoanaerobaculia bacterium]
MSRPGRVLVVEDREDWREELSELLAGAKLEVATAATRVEAAQRLATELFHLVVLDISLEPDEHNQDGMELLREIGRTEAIRVIVLSAYGTKARQREAFGQYKVFDFQDKQEFDDLEFLARVAQLFSEEMQINLGLEINYRGDLNLARAVLNLSLDGQRVKRDTPLQQLLATELDDLLCRLFHNAESLLVSPLGVGVGGGGGVMAVRPFYGEGAGRAVVVKFGGSQETERELQNFTRFVQPYVGGGRNTSVLGRRRTPRLGGIVYSLLGGASDSFEDFATFYRRADGDEIARAVDRLFLDTCQPWYASLGRLRPIDLTRHYVAALELAPAILDEALSVRLKSVQGRERLSFHSLPHLRPLPNPILTLGRQSLVFSTYETITHGDFNGHNVLVDGDGHCWLIDFQRTGIGHVLRDAVQLDTIVRLLLLGPDEATLAERLELEEALGSAASFADTSTLPGRLRSPNPAVAKAFLTCAHLRGLAAKLIASHREADIGEYYAGTLYCALKTASLFRTPTLQREHALLSACLTAERLGL